MAESSSPVDVKDKAPPGVFFSTINLVILLAGFLFGGGKLLQRLESQEVEIQRLRADMVKEDGRIEGRMMNRTGRNGAAHVDIRGDLGDVEDIMHELELRLVEEHGR